MNFSSMKLFSIILIIFVVFILFLSSPVYKMISGKGDGFGIGNIVEGMTSGANEMGLPGAGTSDSPYIVPATIKVNPNDINWKQNFENFAELWLTKLNATQGQLYTTSDNSQYLFSLDSTSSNGNINYSGFVNGSGWGWTSPPLSPPPAPYVNPNPIPAPVPNGGGGSGGGSGGSTPTIPDPTPGAKAGFARKKCNIASKRDGNCIPVCVPISGGKVAGKPFMNNGPDGLTFDMGTANYFYNMSTKYAWLETPGEYYPITDPSVSRVIYGSDTDCTQNYACSARGLPGSDGVSANCNPAPSPPSPSGGCDPSCTKVLNPFDANGQNNSTCSYNKDSGYTCSACPVDNNGNIDCNNFEICSGCGSDLTAYFGPDWQPDGRSGPSDQPYTRSECEAKCKKPDVQTFQNYLNTYRDGAGFDDGSCKIIKRNMIKCKPISNIVVANGNNKPFFSPTSECILCNNPKLQGYATFKRKWDNYTKENNYVDVKIVSGPGDGGGDGSGSGSGGQCSGPDEICYKGDGGGSGGGSGGGDGGGGGKWRKWEKRGAKYGPYSGGGGGWGSGGGSAWGNWGSWNGGGGDGGWRGNGGYGGGGGSGGGGGWYQSLSDVKNKSFQVAASNAESSRQQAYIESLKLELNKINDEYTTQQGVVNKMKADIDKMVSACQNANSKLNDAMRSSVSDNMNKNAAITLKEKIDANTKSGNIATLKQNVKMSCDNANQVNISYGSALQQLKSIDMKRQALIEKLVIAMNAVSENKTTININLLGGGGGGGGGMGDCGDRLGCGQGINNNNMYPDDYFKKHRIDDSYKYSNTPMPYQDLILF